MNINKSRFTLIGEMVAAMAASWGSGGTPGLKALGRAAVRRDSSSPNKRPPGAFKRNMRASVKARNVKRHRAACN